MTERYSFAVDRHLVPTISVDGSVVWNQENIDTVNSTLTDTINESYVTAEETQYLSVLDSTNEISLENLNITLTDPKLEVEDNADTFIANEDLIEQAPEEGNDQQVVVYSVEGSDELYGIQIAQDEEGNLQKYQFQFRKNKEGHLEAIPETIQLLPMEEEIQEGNIVENLEQQEEMPLEDENVGLQHSMHIFVQEDNSHEHILPDRNIVEEQEEQEMDENTSELYDNENVEEVDVKPGILSMQSVKQEIQEHHLAECDQPDEEETFESFPDDETDPQFHQHQEEPVEEANEQALLGYEDQIDQDSVASEENSFVSETPMSNEEVDYETDKHAEEEGFEHIEVNPDMEVNQQEENGQELDSDMDDNYQIVEGVHITADVPPPEQPTPVKTSANNILRHALKTNKEPIRAKKDNRLFLYVVQHPEKENVDSLSLDMANLCSKPYKTNPRSILKSSFQARFENEALNQVQNEHLIGKRFARCKEAVQARNFHNFINKTTIPQAPIRKDRLPRKQKIKPVERMDEEIVVQEVMVSNNGFVEAVGEGLNKENLEVTEYVELTDSDDDYDPNRRTNSITKKKKKHKRKKIEIMISDESEEESVIELDESDEDQRAATEEGTPPKRRRGRPPKIRPETEKIEAKKPEIPCPKCDKTFPSQNSLKTHLQHHSLQNSLKNSSSLPEQKYKCEQCSLTFKNGILLKKHKCESSCSVCRKRFQDQTALNVHRRVHAKEQLLRSTSAAPPVASRRSAMFRSPRRPNGLKCKTCGKLCSSLQNLGVHSKTHREYACATCCSKFLSQLALERHLRESCVKSPQNLRRSPRASVQTTMKVSCDRCGLQFASFQTLFKHKVGKHGMETPDESVLERGQRRTVQKRAHGGIPAAKKLQDVYSELKCKLDF